MHLSSMYAWLRSALVSKGCNFIAPLALIQQFFIALFFHFYPTMRLMTTLTDCQSGSSSPRLMTSCDFFFFLTSST